MDQKTWLWRKRSSEKTIVAHGKTHIANESDRDEVIEVDRFLSLDQTYQCQAYSGIWFN